MIEYISGLVIIISSTLFIIRNYKKLYKNQNEEILIRINNMKNDIILNKMRYSFIDINNILNKIVNLYIRCNFMEDYLNMNEYKEHKRKQTIRDIKIRLLVNYKNELLEEIIIGKNNNNQFLKKTDIITIKTKLENYKKNMNDFFELVEDINNIDIQINNYN
jgi:hypothetical protein